MPAEEGLGGILTRMQAHALVSAINHAEALAELAQFVDPSSADAERIRSHAEQAQAALTQVMRWPN